MPGGNDGRHGLRRTRTRGGRGALRATLATVGVLGAVLLVVGLTTQDPAPPDLAGPVGKGPTEPAPSGPAAGSDEEPGDGSDEPTAEPAPGAPPDQPLGPSEPVSISIPAIDVGSEVFGIGKNPDGTLAVPQPGPNLDKVAWFENSPTPGQPGPSVVEGHVATEQRGPSVFFRLAELRPGDRVAVERADGRTVVFEVQGLREFAKDSFPTEAVYGGDLTTPGLRLITCSDFDPSVGTHTSNLVVYTTLVDVRDGTSEVPVPGGG